MTKTSLTILWLAAAGLGGSVAWVKMNQSHQAEATTSRTRGETLFETFPSAQIARISIKSAKDKVTLVKGDKGWTVAERDGYPADTKRINELLSDLEDVKITQGIQAGPTYDKRFGMDPVADTPEAHGIQIIFSAANDTQLASVTLGKTLESNSGGLFGMGGGVTGRFIRNRAEPDAVYVTSETFPRVVATPKDWLREDFIAIEKIKSISVTMPNKKDFKPWKLVRPDEVSEFKLSGAAKDEKLDPPAVTPLKSLFSYARFEDVTSKDAAKQLNKSPDLRVVAIETVEGFTYTVRFAPKPKKADDKKAGKPGASAAQNYLLTVQVKANIPKQRKKAKDEKKEDVKKLDEAFAKRSKELSEKLEKEKQLEGYVFEVTRWPIEALLKERSQLIAKTTPATPGGMNRQPHPGTGMPHPPRRRIEAVTPPVAIPPLLPDNKPKTDADKPKQSTPKNKPQPQPQPAPAKPAVKKPQPQPAPAKPAAPKEATPPSKPAEPKQSPAPEKKSAPEPPAAPAKAP